MIPDAVMLALWVSIVGFFVLGVVAVVGFVMMSRDLKTLNAVQAAIFLQMRQSFQDFDAKMNELMRRR